MEAEHTESTHDEVLAIAKEQGLEVFFDVDNVLMLDIDTEEGMKILAQNGEILANSGWKFGGMLITKSKSGRDHVYIQIVDRYLTIMERVALQGILGSDRKHELLNFLTAKGPHDKRITYLFETPEAAKTVREWAREHKVTLQ